MCESDHVCDRDPVCGRDPVCEWCGCECAKVHASQRAECERDGMCEVAVCEGDDVGHAGTRNRMSECHDMVCERRGTQVCVD